MACDGTAAAPALEDAGFVTRSGEPIPEERAREINQVVREALGCLHLLEPQGIGSRRTLLTDGGVKFFLEVREVERLGSRNR